MEFDLENPLPTSLELHSDSVNRLFRIESDHMPAGDYFQRLKLTTDSNIAIRRETISLILHFCHNFSSFLSYLAVNYLDRFLSTQVIQEGRPSIMRLAAISCISLALKMKKTEFSVTDIQQDGGIIFDTQTIQRMEYLILGALKWRMRSITPFSFLNFFIFLFKFKDPSFMQALKARATAIIFEAQIEIKLLQFKPSVVAASALLSASHELFPLQFPCFRTAISHCSNLNKDDLFNCYSMMQDMVMDGYESSLTTPVNVLDQQFWSPSSGSEKTNSSEGAIATATAGIERDVKHRKINSFRSDNMFQLSQIQQC